MSRNWWGAVWLEKMEKLAESRRFSDGMKYAAANRVLQMRFEGRTVTARVQGTAEQPYTVRITFDPFADDQWEALFSNVRDRRALAKSLSEGDLPLEIQTAFTKAKLRFMPERHVDLHMECACPDWLKPCKHLVAVWLKFGRDFERDPFLLFQLRGMKHDDLFDLLQGRPQPMPEPEPASGPEPDFDPLPVQLQALPTDPEAFWQAPAVFTLPDEAGEPRLMDEDLFEKLGRPAFANHWPAMESQFYQICDSVYDVAATILRK